MGYFVTGMIWGAVASPARQFFGCKYKSFEASKMDTHLAFNRFGKA